MISTSLTRRQLVAAALASTAVPALAQRRRVPRPTRLRAMLDQFAQELLQLSPENATSLGLDKGRNAGLRSRLSDGSLAGQARWSAQVRSMLARLGTIDRARLSAAEQVRYDTVRYAAERGVEGTEFFYSNAATGWGGGGSPYPVSQLSGTILNLPEFLNSQHAIKNGADAEAYLARVATIARQLDDESTQIRRDASRNVMPPAFIAATALKQLREYRAKPAGEQGLVKSLAMRAEAAGVRGDWLGRATRMVETMVYPALDRQIETFAAATARSSNVAGVHRLPSGEAFYRYMLKLGTTTTMSPQEIHDIGQAQNRELQARMDEILKAEGMTRGSVGERVQTLTRDPKHLFADSAEGRAAVIAYCNDRVADIRKLMPQLTRMNLKAPVEIKRVPEDIQDGQPLGYMNFAALDGSRPAIYYINLKSMSYWPRFQLTSLTAHEALPGHAWHGAYLAENSAEVPLISSLVNFNAFSEGWALYAEQIVDEAGLYASDPLSRLGYLQAQQFRACRLVVDTGLHALKWTREKAIRFLVENTGRAEAGMTSEIDRYCVWPGQACGYKVGHNEIVRLREQSKAAQGARFDLRAFNDAIIQTGGVPMTVLAKAMEPFTRA